jgi:putative membrane protein
MIKNSLKPAIISILLISAGAFGFLTWLIYIKQTPEVHTETFAYLPLVNCMLNILSTFCVLMGLYAVKRSFFVWHGSSMLAAFVFSVLFFITYSIYHAVHGDSSFTATGFVRPVYFFILISHILMTMVTVPLILWTFFLGITKRFERHKIWAKWTYPLWIYVSVTGVLIYVFLKAFEE